MWRSGDTHTRIKPSITGALATKPQPIPSKLGTHSPHPTLCDADDALGGKQSSLGRPCKHNRFLYLRVKKNHKFTNQIPPVALQSLSVSSPRSSNSNWVFCNFFLCVLVSNAASNYSHALKRRPQTATMPHSSQVFIKPQFPDQIQCGLLTQWQPAAVASR